MGAEPRLPGREPGHGDRGAGGAPAAPAAIGGDHAEADRPGARARPVEARPARGVPRVLELRDGAGLPVPAARHRGRHPDRRQRAPGRRADQPAQGKPRQRGALDATAARCVGRRQGLPRADLGEQANRGTHGGRQALHHRGGPRRRAAEVQPGHGLAALHHDRDRGRRDHRRGALRPARPQAPRHHRHPRHPRRQAAGQRPPRPGHARRLRPQHPAGRSLLELTPIPYVTERPETAWTPAETLPIA
ncbi:hypothetical protein OF001_U40177 [Pseudomonas sp. OF001]|nr:hypothetical protein OF001_U40177 [Pseudomonas sp. OF001]